MSEIFTYLPSLLNAFVSDRLSFNHVHWSSTAGTVMQLALERVMKRREEQAREVLLDELRKGRKTEYEAASEDEAAAILFRYLRAAQEGTARRNLRLMAQVIRKQLEACNLVASEFLYFAGLFEDLRREEILILSTMWRNRSAEPVGRGGAWSATIRELSGTSAFPDGEMLYAFAIGLMRHGLLRLLSGFDGTNTPELTVLAAKIVSLCDVEAACGELD
ncbi:MAG TPA: hypothetical protein VM639_22915 [Dongiaceae bacterium]|nr:hypothetical protein [Dongiaceae bacterium]